MNKNEIHIKRIEAGDVPLFKKLIELFNAVFETGNNNVADDLQLKKLLEGKDFVVLIAETDNEIVGGLTAYEFLSYTGNFSEVYIYDIAISTKHQRKGVGKILIEALKNYCRANNIKTMFVEAHEEDQHAVNFYHSTKASAEKVVHFNYDMDK